MCITTFSSLNKLQGYSVLRYHLILLVKKLLLKELTATQYAREEPVLESRSLPPKIILFIINFVYIAVKIYQRMTLKEKNSIIRLK